MVTGLLDEDREISSAQVLQRCRLFSASLATAAGVGLQPLNSAYAQAVDARSQAPARASTDRRSHLNEAMQQAIKACLDCHSMCLDTAMNHCLQLGGRRVEQKHFRLMLNCAELCQTSANFMLSNSTLHGRVCGVCAEACEACAKSCDQVGEMGECAEECRKCAKSCRTMS